MTGQTARPRVYLDHNATAPLRPEAREIALAAMAAPANPSSVHAEGRRARAMIEDARIQVAALVCASAEAVLFTSGATEAAATALSPDLVVDGRPGLDRLLVCAVEHAAVLHGHRFPPGAVTVLPVYPDGSIDLDALGVELSRPGRALVALQAANNETGVIQPVEAAAALVRERGGVLLCDAVQAAGRRKSRSYDADMLLLSGHKLGGMPGAGALVLASGRALLGAALLRGGGQERGLRSGTENVAAIAAFGASAACGVHPSLAVLRDCFEAALIDLAPDAIVFGAGAPRLPNTCAFAIPGIPAERLLMALDLEGVAVSSGSACASGKVGRSHVLDAMNVKSIFSSGAIRVSLGWDSTEAGVRRAVDALGTALHRMRRGRRSAAA